jgi:DNA-binding LacI/PurR family transcriptional regulator
MSKRSSDEVTAMPVRMSEVAARTGVSVQTVSRVLRGQRWVAPATEARVRLAMEELGYRRQVTSIRRSVLFHEQR